MSVVYVLLPLALLLGAVAVAAFFWAARTGQFDDLETPALRLLHEDEEDPGAHAAPRGEEIPCQKPPS